MEAISLAHDLGHTPFGHAGQDTLNACMKDCGGFEHNLQSLRVVDDLEQRYGAFDGLNLMFETREGILKHCSLTNAAKLGDVGQRFIERKSPSLEAQLANLADEIAYNNHDIDDGLRSGLLSTEQLDQIDIYGRHRREVEATFPGIAGRRAIHETIRRMINALIVDLIETSAQRIHDARSAKHRRGAQRRAADPLFRRACAPKRRVAEALPARESVPPLPGQSHDQQGATHRQRIVFGVYARTGAVGAGLSGGLRTTLMQQARKVADYIAGMTDRYAMREHRRLFMVDEI